MCLCIHRTFTINNFEWVPALNIMALRTGSGHHSKKKNLENGCRFEDELDARMSENGLHG